MTMHDKIRAADVMTADEKKELLEAGWHPDVVASLELRGFRPCKPDYIAARAGDMDFKSCLGFVRQTAMPHLYITLQRDPLPHVMLERIDSAIHDAGCVSGHQSLAGHFMRFFELCKSWRPAPDLRELEERLKVLEAHQKAV